MKLINADEFLQKLEDYAITDADREFCRKVKFALTTEPPVDAIPITFLDKYKEDHPGYVSMSITSVKNAWRHKEMARQK